MNKQNNQTLNVGQKVALKWYLLLYIIIVALTMPSCMIEELATEPDNDRIKVRGSGDMIMEDLDLPFFNSISMNTAGLVEITSGTTQEVVLTVDDNVREYISIRVQDNYLIIETVEDVSLSDYELTVEITMTDLKSLVTNSAGSIIGLNTFEEDDVSLLINSAGNISLDLRVNQLNSMINSAGNLFLRGQAKNHSTMLSSAGNLSAFGLETETTGILLNSAGSAQVSVSKLLDVTINSAGCVFYKGHPQIIQHINSVGCVVSAN